MTNEEKDIAVKKQIARSGYPMEKGIFSRHRCGWLLNETRKDAKNSLKRQNQEIKNPPEQIARAGLGILFRES